MISEEERAELARRVKDYYPITKADRDVIRGVSERRFFDAKDAGDRAMTAQTTDTIALLDALEAAELWIAEQQDAEDIDPCDMYKRYNV